jgi:DNA-binding beta-propeller fold protein YncE
MSTGTTTGTTDTTTGTTTGEASTGAPVPADPPPDEGESTRPLIVDARNIFLIGENAGGGGWGLAERPCRPGGGEVPGVTTVPLVHGGAVVECARPLVYSSFRTGLFFARFLPDTVRPTPAQHCIGDVCDAGDPGALVCKDEMSLAQGECCIGEDDGCAKGGPGAVWCEGEGALAATECCVGKEFQSGDPGVVSCDPQLFFSGFTAAGVFDSGGGRGQLGDIAFSRDGRRLFAIQSNPGALLFVDTSVDERGETRDEPAGLVELCNGPTRMALFDDGANEYAAVSCPTPNQVFVVDLSGFRVVANISTGLGPHPLVVDQARRLLYVGNTLDKTISVIDIARDRPTRFAEIARVGLQEPYKR